MPWWLRLVGGALNLSALFDRRWAVERLTWLWFRVFKPRPRDWVFGFWADADTSAELQIADKVIPVYFWGQGPLVVCLHGWGGSGTQFRGMIPRLVARGYRVAAFDAPAHGYNPGNSTNLLEFSQCLLALQQQSGPIDTVIAHSFGGMATLTAAWQGMRCQRMVLIAPGLDVSELFDSFCDGLAIDDGLRTDFRRTIGDLMSSNVMEQDAWQLFTPETLLGFASERGLLVHDEEDEEVSAGMFLRSQNAWRGVETFRTRGLGHYRILKDDTVADKISGWLGAPAD